MILLLSSLIQGTRGTRNVIFRKSQIRNSWEMILFGSLLAGKSALS